MFTVEVTDPYNNAVWWPNAAEVTPRRFGWAAVGGPRDAELEVTGAPPALMLLLSWLGHFVTIRSPYGTALWWGYIEEIDIGLGSMEVGLSLAGVYNRIAVAYTYKDETGADQRATTTWLEDAWSVSRYGKKELLYSRSDLDNQAAADALAARLLARFKAPAPIVRSGGTRRTARLLCRGHWAKTGWRYYKQVEGKEAWEQFGAADQVIGVGHTSTWIEFDTNTKRVYLIGNQHGFYAGSKVEISGSAANSGTKTVASATTKDLYSYTATTISFDLGDDIRDSANGFDAVDEGDIIQVLGSPANSGMWTATTVEEEGVPDGTDYDHIEVAGSLVATEAAGASITVNRAGYITLSEAVTTEFTGPSVTVTAWGVKVAQSFSLEHDTAAWPVFEIKLRLRKRGSPADTVVVALCNDNAGVPGAEIENAVVAAADVQTDYTWITFALDGINNLTYGTTYWIVISRSGANHPDNYFEAAVDEESTYARGTCKLWTGAAWQARPTAATAAFQVLGKQDTAQQVARILTDTAVGAGLLASATGITSGVDMYQQRDGDDLALDEIERLLEQGTDVNERMLVEVTPARRAVVYQKPSKPETGGEVYKIGAGGVMDMYGRPLEPGFPPAGKWVQIDEPGLADALADNFLFFVDAADYDVSGARWDLQPENAPDPYDIAKIEQG